VVNGESLQSDKYAYKLQWLERWYAWMGELAASDRRAEAGPPAPGDGGGVEAQRPLLTPGEWPARPTIVCGDFNLAPEDRDCWDPKGYAGQLFCSPPERDAFGRVKALGLTDAWRHHHPDKVAFTWWDYRGNGFGLDQGLRIDHFLVSRDVLARSVTVSIDREERGRPGASDHSPVTLHLAD
jgi:exodeoxyribonuclease-3